MTNVKSQQIIDVHAGAEIGQKFATACHANYLQQLAADSITAGNCPEMVVFNLQKLREYLDRVEKGFTERQVPVAEQAVAIMPMMYANEEKFNLMLVPCTHDEQGSPVHPLNKDTTSPEAFFDEFFPPIWNHGSGI